MNDSEKKQRFLQHKGNRSNNKETYTDRSKSTGRKVGFAAVEMTAIKKAMRWVIYTHLLSSMLAIRNNRQKCPILNQI